MVSPINKLFLYMKGITSYIIEKLHLNKDIKIFNDKKIKKDDDFFVISADIHSGDIGVKIYNKMTVKKITDKEITYITNKNKTLTKEYFINSNEFYELKASNSCTAICMPVSYGIELLKTLLKEDITKEFLYKYFDEYDEWIDDYPLNPTYTDNDIKSIIKELETEYVIEKLKLNDKIILSSNEYFPTDDDFEWINKEIVKDDIIEYSSVDDSIEKLRNPNRIIKTWLGILSLTKSVPFISQSGFVYSFPGNFGFNMVHKLVNKLTYKNREIIDFYNKYNDETNKDEDNHINEKIYLKAIKLVIPDINATFKIKPFEPNNYSKKAKELLYKNYKGMFILPFEIKANGKIADCEIGFTYPNYSYYLFTINGEIVASSYNFKSKLTELLS